MNKGKIYITLVNYNGFDDTLDCLVSLTRLNHPNFQIVLLDNGSTNNSLEAMTDVLSGKNKGNYKKEWEEILEGSDFQVIDDKFSVKETFHIDGDEGKPFQHPIIMIEKHGNVGFSRGNNICFRYIMQQGDFAHAWVLNNDTIVDPEALATMEAEIEKNVKIGMVGSVLIYNDEREKIQTVGGGKFFPLLSVTKLMYKNAPVASLKNINKEEAVKKIDFLMGASVLVRKEVLEKVGFFDEDYFVYVEEMDWMHRMKKAGWSLSIAIDSLVYHKDSSSSKDYREFYYYQLNKNNMVFLKKHYGIFYNLLAVVPVLLNTVRITRKGKNLRYAVKGLYEGITFKTKKKVAL